MNPHDLPSKTEGRRPRRATLQPPHRPSRSRGHRRGVDQLVRPRPRLHRGQMGEPSPSLPPVDRRGPGHRHDRPQREGAGRPRAEGAAAGTFRLGVQLWLNSGVPATEVARRAGHGVAVLLKISQGLDLVEPVMYLSWTDDVPIVYPPRSGPELRCVAAAMSAARRGGPRSPSPLMPLSAKAGA